MPAASMFLDMPRPVASSFAPSMRMPEEMRLKVLLSLPRGVQVVEGVGGGRGSVFTWNMGDSREKGGALPVWYAQVAVSCSAGVLGTALRRLQPVV